MIRRLALAAVISALSILSPPAHAAQQDGPTQWYGEESRTNDRTPLGIILYPKHLFNVPEHYEFLPTTSNHDAQNQHSMQWQGQDWETANWNKNWTPKIAVERFYANGTFYKQYTRGNKPKIAVLELGPTFYKLSELDQQRSLKLLADYNQVFEKGFTMIELRDWSKRNVVGSYTPQHGLSLN